MTSRRLRRYWQNDLASLCGIVAAVFLWGMPLTATQPGPSGSRPDFQTFGPTSIEKPGQENWHGHLSSGYNLLALDENRRGTLRERIRERRENRANEKLRENDGDAAQDSNSRTAGRRINAERVQSWIAQLRETIREQIGGPTENRALQPYPGLEGMPPSYRPDVTGPPISPKTPEPSPSMSPSGQVVSSPQYGWMVANPNDVGTPGPELVPPELSPPDASMEEPKKLIPPNDLSQATEQPQASASANNSVQAQDAQITPPATDNNANSEGQQPSKSSGLSGLFSNVTKMFGSGGSNNQEAAKLSESKEDSTPSSEGQPEAKAASRSGTQSPTTIRKTLGEIRKQILLKQSQGQTPVGN